jgi:uncharacterized membrane protein
MQQVLLVVFVLLAPALALFAAQRWRAAEVCGPVVLCYAAGVLAANVGLPVDRALAMQVSGVAVAIAIPLLLLSVDVVGWLRLARSTVLSFGICLLAVMATSALASWIFAEQVPRSGDVAGMLVGIYTGGTPNMAAIGRALGVDAELFVMVNAADIVFGSAWLLVLLSFGPKLLGRFLPPFQGTGEVDEEALEDNTGLPPLGAVLRGLAVALGCVGIGVGLSVLVPKGAADAVAILGLTTAAVLASTRPGIRSIERTWDVGQYALLVFCVAIGCLADADELAAASGALLAFTAVAMFGAIFIHIGLCALLRIDRDTAIITSTAAVFGPAFVAPVAERLGNRQIVLSGITTGLVGYAVGNYLGLALAWMLR